MSQRNDPANWLTPLIRQLEPSQRLTLARELGRGLRQRQAQRIKDQITPDGRRFIRRKPQSRSDAKQGPMFAQLRKYKYLKFKARSGEISVGWFSHAAHVARIHHYGLEGTVGDKYSPKVQYHQRELLGLSEEDMEWVLDMSLEHINRQ